MIANNSVAWPWKPVTVTLKTGINLANKIIKTPNLVNVNY